MRWIGLLASLFVIGCGSATPPRASSPVVTAAPLVWEAGAFSLTLSDGVRVSMDASARILRDDAHVASLSPDGRIVDAAGHSIATLLPDGQFSHRGNLTSFRIHDDVPAILLGTRQTLVRAEYTDFVIVEGDAVRIAPGGGPDGSAVIAWGAPAHDHVRPIVALVVLLDLLEHPRRIVPPSLAVRGR